MSVRRNFEIGWKPDALNDRLGFRWITEQDDDLRTLEHRVLFPHQVLHHCLLPSFRMVVAYRPASGFLRLQEPPCREGSEGMP